jgi:ABC-2 type transport system ATP-binding protein
VVRDFSMQVQRGEIYGFLGPNGSGKTTTIRMLCGLLTPDSGSGTCLGFDILRESAQIKRQVGYMTQRFSLWEDLSLRENLDFIARMYDMGDRKAAVSRTLEQLGLTSRQNQLAGALSGGWKQRLALAACMLHEPKLLLLDEPTAGVDPKARRDFWAEIHELASSGISVLVSTHYMDEAERCHRLAYISFGALLASGTGTELIARQGLATWTVAGPDLTELEKRLLGTAGVLQDHIAGPPAVELRVHRRYNPEGITAYNIVPGLLGVILTMTMVLMTGLAMTRERERGTLENLLSTPAGALEVMTGKIVPYILIGLIQVVLVLVAARYLFEVPMQGSLLLLFGVVLLFIAANLTLGITFSALARNQLQAMQMTFFFFLPSLLLSGFMFPFRGMPDWAQVIGNLLPLTHFLALVRGILLKGSGIAELWPQLWPILLFTAVVLGVGLKVYRRTLD